MAQNQAKTQAQIFAEIVSGITTNGTGNITGLTLNNVLSDMTNTLNGSNYLYPVDSSVTPDDVGKLLMNDGTTGLAKVYNLNPGQQEQPGIWEITPTDASVFNNNNNPQIAFDVQGNEYSFSYSDWAHWFPNDNGSSSSLGTLLNDMRRFLLAQPELNNLQFSVLNDNTLRIAELYFQGTIIHVSNFNNNNGPSPLVIIQKSLPTMIAMPTYFPLGKLIGLTGNQALISCNLIDTYCFPSPVACNCAETTTPPTTAPVNFSVTNSLFNYYSLLNINSWTQVTNVLGNLIVPGNDGTVASFDFVGLMNHYSNYTNANNTVVNINPMQIMQYQFVGFALSANAYSVTVYNNSFLSFYLSIVLRLITEGVFQIGTTTTVKPLPPVGSGSGSGSGYPKGGIRIADEMLGELVDLKR